MNSKDNIITNSENNILKLWQIPTSLFSGFCSFTITISCYIRSICSDYNSSQSLSAYKTLSISMLSFLFGFGASYVSFQVAISFQDDDNIEILGNKNIYSEEKFSNHQ